MSFTDFRPTIKLTVEQRLDRLEAQLLELKSNLDRLETAVLSLAEKLDEE